MSDFEFETETRALRLLAKIHEANKINASNESIRHIRHRFCKWFRTVLWHSTEL
jgi:hypothetical protein